MTVSAVADVLKLNQQTVRNWIDAGSLPALRIGRRVRIQRSDFDRFVDQRYAGREPRVQRHADEAIWSGEIPLPGVPEVSGLDDDRRLGDKLATVAVRP